MKSCTKILVILLSSAASAVIFSSCVTTTPEKKHVYNWGEEKGNDVSNQSWTRPSNTFDGGSTSGMPQTR